MRINPAGSTITPEPWSCSLKPPGPMTNGKSFMMRPPTDRVAFTPTTERCTALTTVRYWPSVGPRPSSSTCRATSASARSLPRVHAKRTCSTSYGRMSSNSKRTNSQMRGRGGTRRRAGRRDRRRGLNAAKAAAADSGDRRMGQETCRTWVLCSRIAELCYPYYTARPRAANRPCTAMLIPITNATIAGFHNQEQLATD